MNSTTSKYSILEEGPKDPKLSNKQDPSDRFLEAKDLNLCIFSAFFRTLEKRITGKTFRAVQTNRSKSHRTEKRKNFDSFT